MSALALAGSATACAHHNDGEVVPEHERAELLKKWDQEVCISAIAIAIEIEKKEKKPPHLTKLSSGPSPASPASPT